MANKSVRLNIKRQDTPQSQPYWEEFELRWRPGMNVISALAQSLLEYWLMDRHGAEPTKYCGRDPCGHRGAQEQVLHRSAARRTKSVGR
jgi:succinate dehydrogenase / fumarate reductase, iron-sulfur subunit